MQSFSVRVKEDLCLSSIRHLHCANAELAGIIHACGALSLGSEGMFIKLSTENKNVVTRIFSLVKKVYQIDCQLLQSSGQLQKDLYQLIIKPSDFSEFMKELAIPVESGFTVDYKNSLFLKLIERNCCKAAYLRGAILGGGIISDPQKNYHMEFTSGSQATAEAVIYVLSCFQLHAKLWERKNGYSAYLKDAQSISELLTIVGAHSCMLELENARMLKDIRNTVNRQINFENANIDKVVRSAIVQIQNIKLIDQYRGLDSLPPGLQETAQLRLAHPEAPLSELAALSNGISRSGINNRLRKLAEIADSIRSALPNHQ